MRTTVDLPDELFRQLKTRAADQGVAMRQLIEDALRAAIATRPRPAPFRLKWRTETGVLQPGARLDDRDALFDVMEGRR